MQSAETEASLLKLRLVALTIPAPSDAAEAETARITEKAKAITNNRMNLYKDFIRTPTLDYRGKAIYRNAAPSLCGAGATPRVFWI
jgi:hypothetical protein